MNKNETEITVLSKYKDLKEPTPSYYTKSEKDIC